MSGERDDIVQLAFERGRTDRRLTASGKHHFKVQEVAVDLYPRDDELRSAYMEGWNAPTEQRAPSQLSPEQT
jgi:hypothetical protein